MTTELTVILTAHNRADIVEETLASLAEQEWDGNWDVVLVDNDSNDTTLELLERWADKMPVPTRVVEATDRRNLCHARNTGTAASTATSITFVDDDDVLAPGYVEAMAVALRDHRFVGPRHDHRLLNDTTVARARGGFQADALGTMFGAAMVSGGGLGCHRTLWDELGGQDETIGYGAEDADFSLRAALAGATPVFVPDAVYHVRLRGGLRSSFTQGRRFGAARVGLFRIFGERFEERPESVGGAVRRWAGLVLRLPTLRRPGPRLVWVWQLGRRVGHLQGSLRERTWYP